MVRLLLSMLAVIAALAGWCFFIYWNGWLGVRALPFNVDEDYTRPQNIFCYLYLTPCNDLVGKSVDIVFSVSTPVKDSSLKDECKVIVKWPKNPDCKFAPSQALECSQTGMPTVAENDDGMYFAQGLERQIRIVRKAALAQFTLLFQTNEHCRGDWPDIQSREPTRWATHIELVQDSATQKFAEYVRYRFDTIIGQAGTALVIWIVIVPMIVAFFFLMVFTVAFGRSPRG